MVNTTIYILNRHILLKRLKTRHHMKLNTRETPKWVLWEFLDVLHLLKFHPKKEENLIKKYKKCLVIGCCEKSKGYRLLNFKTNKLVILIDVIFDENKTWKVYDGETYLKRSYVEVKEEEMKHYLLMKLLKITRYSKFTLLTSTYTTYTIKWVASKVRRH